MSNIEEAIKLLIAYRDGLRVQYSPPNGGWMDVPDDEFMMQKIQYPNLFRIKKDPVYVPYDTSSEFFEASHIHGPWVILKNDEKISYCPCSVMDKSVFFSGLRDLNYSFVELLDCFKWEDGTPCGKEIKDE